MAEVSRDHEESITILENASSSHGDVPEEHDQDSQDDVDIFVTNNRLKHKLEIFQKAALLIQGQPVEDIPGITNSEIIAIGEETTRRWKQPKLLYFTISVCSIGAIEQGWAQTSMNGANLYFPKAFGIGSNSPRDNLIVGFINGAIYMSAGLL
jgi:hypothetical protein